MATEDIMKEECETGVCEASEASEAPETCETCTSEAPETCETYTSETDACEAPEASEAPEAPEMPVREALDADTCEAISFVCKILYPFYIEDPVKGATASYELLAKMNPQEDAQLWPFAEEGAAVAPLTLMVDTLKAEPTREDLAWEYRRLFVGPTKKVAPLWGSVYTDHDCVAFGESTLKLRAWVRDNGVPRATDPHNPEDNFGLMLLQLSWICENRPELVKEYLALHLLTWGFHFLDVMEAGTKSTFYQGLTQLTRLTLKGIQDELEITVETPKFYR